MKPAALLASLAAFLAPASQALACPAAREACASGCSSLGSYMAALGVGLLVGIGSVCLEGVFRRR
jgi:hypothetical protein